MPKKPEPEFPHSFVTFQKPCTYTQERLTCPDPYVFNGTVGVRKYRVTFEVVKEPKAVLVKRLRKLWRGCDNHHLWAPLQHAARQLGVELSHEERGVEKRK